MRWEQGGALGECCTQSMSVEILLTIGTVHHCPQCQTPLTNPRSQKRCLGDHVEWCRNYHFQLFKKGECSLQCGVEQTADGVQGGSIQCMACRNSDEQQDKRWRNIGELIRQLREVSSEEVGATPKTPTAPQLRLPSVDGSATKKDRKDAKKAAKAAARPRIITSKDVKRIGDILNPPVEDEEEDFEKALMKDEDIKMNVYYHRGTANTHEMRHRFIKQFRAGQFELDIRKAEMDRIMSELKVPDLADAKTKVERSLISQIQNAVEEDLVHVHGEERQTMQRKAGFWRWANTKAYNRLVENGRIWDWKVDQVVPAKTVAEDLAMVVAEDQTVDGAEVEATPYDEPTVLRVVTGNSVSSRSSSIVERLPESSRGGPAFFSSVSRNTSASSASRTTSTSIEDDGWATVGKVKPVPPRIQLKLVSNGGLSHLTTKASPWSPKNPKGSAAFNMLSTADESEEGYESGDEDSPISPRSMSARSPLFSRSNCDGV